MKSINTEGNALICSGEDTDPASPTVGSNVVHWSRPLTAEELATAADYLRRIEASAVNPREGQERYGEVLTARTTWIDGLPREPRTIELTPITVTASEFRTVAAEEITDAKPANETGWHPGALDWIAAHSGNIVAVIMQTERDDEGVTYEVIVRDRTVMVCEGSEDLRNVWSASVRFGHTDATVAGGAAFRFAAREQEKAAERVGCLVRLAGWKPPSTDTLKDRGAWP